MKIIVYLEQLNETAIANMVRQMPVYDSIGETYILDNVCDESATNELLSKLDVLDLPQTTYSINEYRMSLSESLEELILDDYVLVVNESIRIDVAGIKEMYHVAQKNEHHSIVVPRSNGNSMGRYPGPVEYNNRRDITEWLNRFLRDYTLLAYADFPCVLFDMSRIYKQSYPTREGNFTNGFSKDRYTLSAALMELSLIMGDYGHSTVCADHAYAEQIQGDLHSSQEIESVNHEFENAITDGRIKYFEYYQSASERYGQLIGGKKKKIKVLYFLLQLMPFVNGGTVHMLGILDGILQVLNENDDYQITVVAPKESIEKHGLYDRLRKCRVIELSELEGMYDVCFVPIHLLNREYQKICCDHSLKLIFWPLDLISIRSNYLCDPKDIRGFEFIARYADGLMFFSNSVRNDFEAYFEYIEEIKTIPCIVSNIPDAAITMNIGETQEELPFSSYYLAMGNKLLHKMIYPTIVKLAKTGINVIFVGAKETRMLGKNMYLLESGKLSDSFMAKLYKGCEALIYPSIYEGFGLPPVQALNLGKEVFAMDIPVNHELEKLTEKFKGHIHYMSSLDELPEMLCKHKDTPNIGFEKGTYKRNWSDVGRDCLKMIEIVLNTDIDEKRLNSRRAVLQ